METYIPAQDILINIKFNANTSETEKKLLKDAIDQIIKGNNNIHPIDDQVLSD
jgi:hypothetical protein